ELKRAAEETSELLGLLPAPAPGLQLDDVLRRANAPWWRRSGLIAAAVTILAVTVAGATGGRPVLRAVAAWFRSVGPYPATPPSPRPPATASDAQMGVAVVPGRSAEIVFDTTQVSGMLRVSLADTVELAIRSSAPVAYRISPTGVAVHNGGRTASYEI